jgi:Tfp pilus assembly protein PilF
MNLENPANPALNAEGMKEHAGSIFGRDISAAVFKNCLVYLFLLGLIVRVGFLVEHAHTPSFGVPTLDQQYYDSVAKMLLAGEDLHKLHGFRPLLYPMFVAVFYKLGGQNGVELTVAVQHLLGVLTGVLVALLGARLFRHRISGLAGGTLYLLAPIPLYFEGELLIESSYVFLICLGLLLILHTASVTGWKSALLWMLCGAFTVLTAQMRPNILVFMAVYPCFAAWRWWHSRQTAALLPLLALIGAGLMGIPWGFVNKLQSGHFQVIPTTGGVNLYLGNRRTADGIKMELDRYVNYNERYEDSVEVWARQGYENAMRAEGRQPDANPKAVSQYWTRRAIAEIKADPAAWLRLMAKKTWLTFWNAEIPTLKSFAFLRTEYAWLRWLPVRWVVLLMLAPAGIWAAVKWGNRDALFILAFYAAIYLAANIAFFIVDRYRYPVWPAMAAIGGGGLLAFVETIHRRWRRAALGIAASMVLMALISLPNWYGAQLPSFALDYRLRSIAWYDKGHFSEALADIDRSLALDANDVTSLDQRGNILLALNQLDEARKDYERSLKINPEDGGVWNNYGVALEGLGRTNEALQAFHRAIECKPPSENAFIGLAFEQIKSGRLNNAAATLDQFEKVDNGPNAVALAIRSVLARLRGDTAQADALEQQAHALDSDAAEWAIKHASSK